MTQNTLSLTRRELVETINGLGSLSKTTRNRVLDWAWRADSVTIGHWDGCAMDQAGLVKEFEQRTTRRPELDTVFANEGNAIDHAILTKLLEKVPTLEGHDLVIEVSIYNQ